MNFLNKLILLLLLSGIVAPVHAVVAGIDIDACSIFSDKEDDKGDDGEDDKKEGEEEPDCE